MFIPPISPLLSRSDFDDETFSAKFPLQSASSTKSSSNSRWWPASGPIDDSEPPSAQLPQGATLQFKVGRVVFSSHTCPANHLIPPPAPTERSRAN